MISIRRQGCRPSFVPRSLLWAIAIAVLFVSASRVEAQVSIQKTPFPPQDIGLNGYVKPGEWTPLRVTLDNQASAVVAVVCQWEYIDADGEQVFANRKVTLSPTARQSVTLYAKIPANTTPRTLWTIRVSDAESGKQLDSTQLFPPTIVDATIRMVAVTGPAKVGLYSFINPATQHEAMQIVQGLDPKVMPDRWYGMQSLSTIIWTSDSSDPSDANIPKNSQDALREWVRRGGHLIISPASAGDLWSDSSFKDLLPVKQMISGREKSPPWWMGDLIPESIRINVKTFEPMDDAEVLLRESPPTGRNRPDEGQPTVVTRQYGLGRVTIMGVDLVDPRVVKNHLPSGRISIWNRLLGFKGSNLTDIQIDALRGNGKLLEPSSGSSHYLDNDVISPLIDMQEAAAAPLLIAIVAFGLYWLAAGPVGFIYLRQKKMLHQSWLVFACVVIVFGVIAWIGGFLLRPSGAKIKHFSVMDIDGATGTFNTKSWLSLYTPSFGMVNVSLDRAKDADTHDVIGAPGLTRGEATFTDARRYSFESTAPDSVAFPFRATAKQLEIDYLGNWQDTKSPPFPGESWAPPQGHFTLDDKGWPKGKASHALPGVMRDCMVVFIPGDGRQPYFWSLADWPSNDDVKKGNPKRSGSWSPGDVLTFDRQPIPFQLLYIEAAKDENEWGGALATSLKNFVGRNILDATPTTTVSRSKQEEAMAVLTFFDALPPPKTIFKDSADKLNGMSNVVTVSRGPARRMDLSRMLGFRRLLIFGHLEDAPLIAPLKVNGGTVPSKGWTMVRWVMPISGFSGASPTTKPPGGDAPVSNDSQSGDASNNDAGTPTTVSPILPGPTPRPRPRAR